MINNYEKKCKYIFFTIKNYIFAYARAHLLKVLFLLNCYKNVKGWSKTCMITERWQKTALQISLTE